MTQDQAKLTREHLVPGAVVTISTNKSTGDRSYTNELFSVVGSNGGHVVVCAIDREGFWGRINKRIILQLKEHDFYPADHLVDLLKDEGTGGTGGKTETPRQ